MTNKRAEFNWTAFPKQAIFLGSFAEVDEVMFGGSAGPGKSEALLIYAAQRRLKYAGSSGLFLRRTFKQLALEGGAISASHEIYGRMGATWNATDRKWHFPNGSVQEFGHCQDENDKYNFQSAQYLDICFDELTQFTEGIYKYIGLGRARSVRLGARAQIRSATNPGGEGHVWVKKRFVDMSPPYRVMEFTEKHPLTGKFVTRTRAFVPASLRDNPVLLENDPEYAMRLNELPENERRALLEGRWDLFEGQAFQQWNPSLHVIRPFAIPPEWPCWYSVDYGYDAPWCTLWIAKNLDLWIHQKIARYYVYREIYRAGVPAWAQAVVVKKTNADQRILYGVADASMWQGYDAGTSLIGHYERAGIYPRKAPSGTGSRIPAKGAVDWLLDKAADGLPRLQIFECCPHLVKDLPSLQYDKNHPEDIDTSGPDHGFDALKYFATTIVGGYQRHKPQEYRISA